MNTQSDLADYFERQASWRGMRAEGYAGDERNQHAERALSRLAAYVRDLPDDDPRIVVIRTWARDPKWVQFAGFETGLDAVVYPASRIGFSDATVNIDQELTSYVRANLGERIHQLERLTESRARDDAEIALSALREMQVILRRALGDR